MASENIMKASTIALISIGAAILVLGTVFVLTLPKEGWARLQAAGGGFSARAESAPAQEGGPGLADGPWRRTPYPRQGGRRGGPGGLLLLALAIGMGIGFASAAKAGAGRTEGRKAE